MAQAVLITGATGFIGRAVLKGLAGTAWTPIPAVRAPAGLPGEVVLDLAELGRTIATHSLPPVYAVVHLSARVGWGAVPRRDLVAPNVLATGLLAEWARRCGALIIYASAAIVCGAGAPHIDAATPVGPDTDYGWSKWMGEELIRAAGGEAAVLRIAGVFGRDGPPHLGLNRAIAGALAGTPPTLSGDGQGRRNYIYIHDLAEIIVRCLDERITGLHLVAGRSVLSIAEMLRLVCRELLPGRMPVEQPGPESWDQIVAPSPALPARRTFAEALQEIRREVAACA